MTEEQKQQTRERIGQRIADLRKEKGLTQLDIANKTGIQRCHVARIEAGRYSVGLDTLAMIGDAMDMNIDYVERGGESFPRDTHVLRSLRSAVTVTPAD